MGVDASRRVPLLQYTALHSFLMMALLTLDDCTDERREQHSEPCLHRDIKRLWAGREVATKDLDYAYQRQKEQHNASGKEPSSKDPSGIARVQECAIRRMSKDSQRKQHQKTVKEVSHDE
ncbi:hypothetical protein ACFY05_36500 [Microtetraspora fusca]|uniref:Uncharacterized protein n=2 Tax=Microtetraspora fusca TaxID=1997 RepID=A0ABW6VG55_MICFU